MSFLKVDVVFILFNIVFLKFRLLFRIWYLYVKLMSDRINEYLNLLCGSRN